MVKNPSELYERLPAIAVLCYAASGHYPMWFVAFCLFFAGAIFMEGIQYATQ